MREQSRRALGIADYNHFLEDRKNDLKSSGDASTGDKAQPSGDDPEGYEERRAEKIARNKAFLASLHIEEALEALKKTESKGGVEPEGKTKAKPQAKAKSKPKPKPKPKEKAKEKAKVVDSEQRRSSESLR